MFLAAVWLRAEGRHREAALPAVGRLCCSLVARKDELLWCGRSGLGGCSVQLLVPISLAV